VNAVLARSMLVVWAVWSATAAQAFPACTEGPHVEARRCTAGLAADLRERLQQWQRASNWCWAASISMVLQSHGVAVRQEEVVRAQFGLALDLGITPEELLRLVDRTWHDRAGRTLKPTLALVPASDAGELPSAQVLEELAAGRPLLVATRGHVMVLVGVAYEWPAGAAQPRIVEAVVLDPARGMRTLSTGERPTFVVRVLPQQDTAARPWIASAS